jgi:hypothetical protein
MYDKKIYGKRNDIMIYWVLGFILLYVVIWCIYSPVYSCPNCGSTTKNKVGYSNWYYEHPITGQLLKNPRKAFHCYRCGFKWTVSEFDIDRYKINK